MPFLGASGRIKLRGNMIRSPANRSDINLIDIAPTPILARLFGLHNGMPCFLEMLGGVFPPRRIAAADVATNQAGPQMDPRPPQLQTFLTAFGPGLDGLYLIEMRAFSRHFTLPDLWGMS
jgi:hypothetical protein